MSDSDARAAERALITGQVSPERLAELVGMEFLFRAVKSLPHLLGARLDRLSRNDRYREVSFRADFLEPVERGGSLVVLIKHPTVGPSEQACGLPGETQVFRD